MTLFISSMCAFTFFGLMLKLKLCFPSSRSLLAGKVCIYRIFTFT